MMKKARTRSSDLLSDRKEVSEPQLAITKRCLKAYGQEVIEQRAVPDFRDGLKPVHRYILWSCYKLGLTSGSAFKKAARTVGDVIGKYSPHGDQATYQAMVGMTGTKSDDGKTWVTQNTCVPLIEGYGNWGDNIDNAAAMRYTEARLSVFADKYMLDPVYLAVSDYVLNFSGDEQVPLVLPAKLPVLLLNGSVSIAFGVSAETPCFKPDGVLKAVQKCLSGEEITPKLLTTLLEFTSPYGGTCISEKKDIFQFHKTGSGSLYFSPEIEVDEKTRRVVLKSSCPGLTSPASWSTLSNNLAQMKEVKAVSDSSDRFGFKFEVIAERSVPFQEFVDKVSDAVVRRYSYSLGITNRTPNGVTFSRPTVASIISDWCTWRVELELKVIKHLIQLETTKLNRLKLMILAVDNLKVIVASLSKDDSAAYIAQHLKITLEEANTILDMKVRQLKALEKKRLIVQCKEVEQMLKTLSSDLKNPKRRILQDLAEMKF